MAVAVLAFGMVNMGKLQQAVMRIVAEMVGHQPDCAKRPFSVLMEQQRKTPKCWLAVVQRH